LSDKDNEVRAQAAHVLGDQHDTKAYEGLLKLLTDSNLRGRYFAAMGLAKLGRKEAVGPILNMVRENADKDAYLRHAGVTALVSIGDFEAIVHAGKDDSRAIRLAALLAMRRLGRPEVAGFLHDPDPQLVLEAARAINDLPITAALPQLAALITDPTLPDFVMIRVVNANFRLGTAQAAGALASFAANSSATVQWRIEALKDLAEWPNPILRDRVTDADRPLPGRNAKVARDAAAPALVSILHDAPDKVRVAALEMLQKLGVTDSAVLMKLESDAKLSPDVRIGALKVLAAQSDAQLPHAIDLALGDKNERVRSAAIEAMAKLPDAAPRIESFLGKGTIREQQAAFAALGEAPGESADDAMSRWVEKLVAGQVPPELQLDVIEAANKRGSGQITQKVQQYEQSLPNDERAAYHVGEFRVALQGGDAASGEQIFHERSDASCLRCHTIHHTGGIVGPVLDGIGTRQNREYLIESIVYPNAKIAKGFESVIVRLNNGNTQIGIVKKETADELELVDADGHKITIHKSDIKTRESGQSAMPEGFGKILSKRDLRDLVEYLSSLK
jgi:quinoprotein glucose dehydrogenase